MLTVAGASYADALAASLARQAETGALLMHAYDQREVVVGAGTLAAEVEADAGVPDRVLVSVGGGGLIAGVASWFQDRCRIDALEPALAPTLASGARSGQAGRRRRVSGIAADSLGARRIGAIAWAADAAATWTPRTCSSDAPIRAAQTDAVERSCAWRSSLQRRLPLAALDDRDGRAAREREASCS